jgi:hypothetical protein
MTNPQLAVLVKFKTALSLEEVMNVAHDRADRFRALSGLRQKILSRIRQRAKLAASTFGIRQPISPIIASRICARPSHRPTGSMASPI